MQQSPSERGNFEAVKLLINHKADLNIITRSGSTGKRCAITAAFNYPEILEYIIESGANVNIRLDSDNTPLHILASHPLENQGFPIKSLDILLTKGASINAVNMMGETPLHRCSKQAALKLLEKGANIHVLDKRGWKPLHRAYQAADLDLLKEYMKKGGNLRELTPDGWNSLHYALSYLSSEREQLVHFLIVEQKMDINLHGKWSDGKDGSFTPFMTALGASTSDFDYKIKVLNYLLTIGADINSPLLYGNRVTTQVAYN